MGNTIELFFIETKKWRAEFLPTFYYFSTYTSCTPNTHTNTLLCELQYIYNTNDSPIFWSILQTKKWRPIIKKSATFNHTVSIWLYKSDACDNLTVFKQKIKTMNKYI